MTSSSSLYLHIPFCRIKCTYCAFNTYVNLDNLIEPFAQALIQEIKIVGRSKLKVQLYYLGEMPLVEPENWLKQTMLFLQQ